MSIVNKKNRPDASEGPNMNNYETTYKYKKKKIGGGVVEKGVQPLLDGETSLHHHKNEWWGLMGSNHRHLPWQDSALAY